jgi:hypothetical protein
VILSCAKTQLTSYFLIRILAVFFINSLLTSCASFSNQRPNHPINCYEAQNFCSTGRFAIRYHWTTHEGTLQDAIHGQYEWASFYNIEDNILSPQEAYLAIDSIIGTRLAEIYQDRQGLTLHSQQNPVQKIQNWDELFSKVFHLPLPGSAIVFELIPPTKKSNHLNNLPPGWRIERKNKRIKLEYQDQTNNFITIDILPDNNQ